MKKLDTLVKDIYSLFDGQIDSNLDEKELDKQLETLTTNIKNNLRSFFKEQPRKKRNLRLSSIGKPARQLWYDRNSSEEPIPLEPTTRIKFLYGHILEDLLIFLCRMAGHTVTEEQKEVSVEGIKGHQDCFIDGVLTDCKSASGHGFRKFSDDTLHRDDPFGYIGQISAYAKGNNVDEACFLAIDKQHGNIALKHVHTLEMIDAEERIKYLKKTLDRTVPPDRCYKDIPDGASGNRKLAIGCVFCPHKKLCWSDCNEGKGLRVFNYENGKRFLTNVSRIPKVKEVTEW
jgi:hypothetical protein